MTERNLRGPAYGQDPQTYITSIASGGALYAAQAPCGHVHHEGAGRFRMGLKPPAGGWEPCPDQDGVLPAPERAVEGLDGPSEGDGTTHERGTAQRATCPSCGHDFLVEVP